MTSSGSANMTSDFCFPDGRVLQPSNDPAAWTAVEMARNPTWLEMFSAGEVTTLRDAARKIREQAKKTIDYQGTPLPDLLSVTREDVPLPGLAERLSDIRRELLHGRGFVLFRGLPLEEMSHYEAAAALWAICLHLGDGMWPQNARGHVLGHIKDIGQTVANPLQRGPYSHDTIPFHVDCADIVGLMCLQTAKQGGESRIVSSVHVFNKLLAERPNLVAALTQPIYRDRRGEIPEGMQPWYRLAVFHQHEGRFSANIEPTYIASAKRFETLPPLTDLQREALAKVQELCREQALDMGFQRGDIQFLNNHVIFHARYHFEDFPEPARRRHLLRIWLKCLDGRPLPDDFYLRHGARDHVERPGGVVGPDTRLTAPYDDPIAAA